MYKYIKSEGGLKVAQTHTALKVYTLQEMSEIFHVTMRTVYNWMDDNRFSFVKIGSKTYVTEQQLQEFLTNHQVETFKGERRLK